ncbi:MAG: cytochrome c, partial [Acidobacteriota bacterium]
MKNFKLSSAVLGVTFAAALAVPASAQALPDGPAKATFQTVCSACHGADIVIGMKNDKAAWQAIVDTMKGRGAAGKPADFDAIVNYLATNFGAAPVVAAGGRGGAGGGRGGAAAGGPGGGRGAAAAGPVAQKGRPPLFANVQWKQSPPGSKACPTAAKNCEHPLMAENIGNASLELKLYSNSSFNNGKTEADGGILMTGDDTDEANPSHIWTGVCERGCMAAFRNKTAFVDLTGLARITMNIKTSGIHQARVAVKLADGTWLVGDKGFGTPTDWLMYDIPFAELK